ncbi:tetratricopeptide repeat domain-containing protein [Xylaria sp. FL0064]|nr:tetratricopeptide repeat domain-containing protein [Xylaria sp. FL0064]
MAEVFSLLTATAGLLDVTTRLVKYVIALKNGSITIQQELDSLIDQASTLQAVCNAISHSYCERSISRSQEKAPEQGNTAECLWQDLARMVSHCQLIVERIHNILEDICQPPPQKKRAKEDDLKMCRSELSIYHSSMQIILSIIKREEDQDSQCSTAKSFEQLKRQLETLQSHISNFDKSPPSIDDAGYGKEALCALRDLEAIISNATKLMAPPTINQYFKTPQAVSSIFTGRETLLKELKHCFIQPPGPLRSQSQRRFVVHGLGGSGKTQFCCKFAEDNRERFWGVFFINGTSEKTIRKSLGDIAKLSGRDPNANAALDWLSTIKEQWLLLFDNADNSDIQLDNYFPKGMGGHILITTRNRALRVLGNIEPGYYDFSGLRFDEASSLLLKASSLPRPWEPCWESLALNITEVLGHLALAIVHAGAAIRSRLCSLQDYPEWYKRFWEGLRDGQKVQYATKEEAAIWTTFEICYERLEQKKNRTEAADAIELLHIFAFLSRDDLSPVILTKALKNIQREAEYKKKVTTEEANQSSLGEKLQRKLTSIVMFMVGANTPSPLPSILRDGRQIHGHPAVEDRIRSALSELEKMSLIDYNEHTQTYTMHPVVHKWAKDRPRMKLRYQALWVDVAGHLLSASILLPDLGTKTEDELHHARLPPHIDYMQECREKISVDVDQNSRTRAAPLNRHRVLMSAKFGVVYFQYGNLLKAEELFGEVVTSLTLSLGLGSSHTRKVQTTLADVYWQQGKLNEALDLQRSIATTCEEHFGRENPETLKALHKLSTTLWQRGEFKAAKELQTEVLECLTRVLGAEHADTLEVMNDLGRTTMKFMKQEDILEAFKLFSAALEGMEKTLGADHLTATFAKENLARVSCLIDDQTLLRNALTPMEEVVATRKARMGKEAPWTLMAIGNMAVVLGALGQLEEPERLISEALALAERNDNIGARHIGLLHGKSILATMLIQQKRYNEAEAILIRVVHDQRDMTSRHHDFHSDRIVSMIELARCYERQGQLRNSIDICNEIIEGMEKTAKNGHPFIKTLREARTVMEGLLKDVRDGGSKAEAPIDARFPEHLFKIY